MSYLRIGKCLFARFKMLPATYVFDKGLLCEQYCCYGTIWALFPLGYSPSRRRTVSIDDLIFYFVIRSA
jgi:hypothetical protein